MTTTGYQKLYQTRRPADDRTLQLLAIIAILYINTNWDARQELWAQEYWRNNQQLHKVCCKYKKCRGTRTLSLRQTRLAKSGVQLMTIACNINPRDSIGNKTCPYTVIVLDFYRIYFGLKFYYLITKIHKNILL